MPSPDVRRPEARGVGTEQDEKRTKRDRGEEKERKKKEIEEEKGSGMGSGKSKSIAGIPACVHDAKILADADATLCS
jgi:hypothetical protein